MKSRKLNFKLWNLSYVLSFKNKMGTFLSGDRGGVIYKRPIVAIENTVFFF